MTPESIGVLCLPELRGALAGLLRLERAVRTQGNGYELPESSVLAKAIVGLRGAIGEVESLMARQP